MNKKITITLFGKNDIANRYLNYFHQLTNKQIINNSLELMVETNIGNYEIVLHHIQNCFKEGNNSDDDYNEDNCICDITNYDVNEESKLLFQTCDFVMIMWRPEFVKMLEEEMSSERVWVGTSCNLCMYEVICSHNSGEKTSIYVEDTSQYHLIPEQYKRDENYSDWDDDNDVKINLTRNINMLKPIEVVIQKVEKLSSSITIKKVM